MASQSSFSSSANRPRIYPDIPLITCPDCGRYNVCERVVQTDDNGNKGRVFYRCPGGKRGVGCQFYRWEEEYFAELKALSRKEQALKDNKAQEDKNVSDQVPSSAIDLKINILIDIGKELVLVLKCILLVFVCAVLWNVYSVDRN